MNVCQRMDFGGVEAYRFGFGPIGPPIMSVLMYRVGDVLIDTAQSRMRKQVLGAVQGKVIRHILLTHHHEDHSGNAALIGRQFGSDVRGHPLTREKMSRSFKILPYQHLVWGKAQPTEVTAVTAGEVIETPGFRFRPIHTPGHSRDHTVYLEENNGWLFSGDLYLGDRIKFFRCDEDIRDQIESLKRIRTTDFDRLFCAHRPVPKNGPERIAAKLAFLEDFCGRAMALKNRGYSERAVIRMMDDRRDRGVKWFTMGNASMAHMIRSALRPVDAQVCEGTG